MAALPLPLRQLILDFSAAVGTSPTAESFIVLILGWILCNGRRTLSAVIRAAGPEANKSHDAYQNFFSKAKWAMGPLWKMLFLLLVKVLVTGRPRSEEFSVGTIWLAGDDTLSKHYGRKIWGAGLYRDAVRSSKKHTAYAWGLNWVVLAMVAKVPLLKERFIALPIYARLNPKTNTPESDATPSRGRRPRGTRKDRGKGIKMKKTTVSIMHEMLRTVAEWLPNARFLFCGDGAYACMAGDLPKNVKLVSRIRCDAALYALPPKRTNGRGRPPRKGRRLPCPKEMANRAGKPWQTHEIDLYGRMVRRQLYAFDALWYEVCPDHLIKVVIVRDPEGREADEYLFTTDLDMSAESVVHCYTGRWAIEVVFREAKQYLGMGEPQARKKNAVLRITPFCLWLVSVIKVWFLLESRRTQPTLPENDPWYPHKNTVSFQDMLGSIRLCFWRNYIFAESTSRGDSVEILEFVAKSLAKVT